MNPWFLLIGMVRVITPSVSFYHAPKIINGPLSFRAGPELEVLSSRKDKPHPADLFHIGTVMMFLFGNFFAGSIKSDGRQPVEGLAVHRHEGLQSNRLQSNHLLDAPGHLRGEA